MRHFHVLHSVLQLTYFRYFFILTHYNYVCVCRDHVVSWSKLLAPISWDLGFECCSEHEVCRCFS
jgi:hypothetical protein